MIGLAKKRFQVDDDGRTIVPMDVDGMPDRWRQEEPGDKPKEKPPHERPAPPSRRESIWAMWGMAKAMLLVVGVMIFGIVAFVGLTVWLWR